LRSAAFVVFTFAVLYSSAVSRLRRPFLSDRFFFVTVRGPAQTVLAPMALGAYQTRDLAPDDAFGLLPLPLPFCSIRIQYSGARGSAIAEVSSVESKGDLVIDSRFANEGDGWAGSGGHPWHLDEEGYEDTHRDVCGASPIPRHSVVLRRE